MPRHARVSAEKAETEGQLPPEPKRPPTATRPRGRPKKLKALPDEDPFLLIESLDMLGGTDGKTPRMPNNVAYVFRVYCKLSPQIRSLKQLQQTLLRDDGVAPNPVTLKRWHTTYQWEKLVREYDVNLDRLRLHTREIDVKRINDRQANIGRWMVKTATDQIALLIDEYNRPVDYKNLPVNPSTGRTITPRKSLAGIQALTLMVKVGLEAERVASGMPTVISQGQQLEGGANGGQVNVNVTLTLDEWRRHTAQERRGLIVDADDEPSVPAVPLLPAPTPAQRIASLRGALSPDELASLPDEMASMLDPTTVVDADTIAEKEG